MTDKPATKPQPQQTPPQPTTEPRRQPQPDVRRAGVTDRRAVARPGSPNRRVSPL